MSTTPAQITPIAPPRRRRDFVVHELDGEALMYDPASGDTHHLNPTAWFIWSHCDGLHSPRQIAECVAAQFDITAGQALGHVTRALADMRERGLLTGDPARFHADEDSRASAGPTPGETS